MPVTLTSVPIWKVVAAGTAAGFMSGLFGVGGGFLIVPALIYLLSFDQRLAHGTSLTAVLPIACASFLTYWGTGNIDWWVGLWITLGALAGAVLGTHLLSILPQRTLAFAFIAVLTLTAVRLLMSFEALGRAPLSPGLAAGLVLLGLVAGTLSGLLGIGGGIIMVPAMVLIFHMPPVLAKGTSLAVIIPTSLMGTWRNRRNDNTDIRNGLTLGVVGMVAAVGGGLLSSVMDANLSNTLFALLLGFVIYRQIMSLRAAGH